MKNFFRSFGLLFVIIVLILPREKERTSRVMNPAGSPVSALMNINAISAWYDADGQSERVPTTGNSGLTYPRGTSTAVYASGLMIGAIATDGVSSAPRVTGFSYNKGFQAGAILGVRTGAYESPANVDVRIFRIRRDYATADLKRDVDELGSVSLIPPTQEQVRQQYKKDWVEWPTAKGAPFYDANHDGVYSPQFKTVGGVEVPVLYPDADEPGLANADQVLYYVCNDIGPGQSPWKTAPMGIEQQVTVWGYAAKGVAENILYKRYRLIYKGTAVTPVGSQLTNMYVCHWSDADLGDAGDDFSGCDVDLGLGFTYNSKTLDSEYRKFNLVPPAIGYDFLQGPAVPSAADTAIVDLKKKPGYKNLPMTSFIYFAAGGTYSDPPFTLNGSVQWYQMLRGLPPTPQGPPDPAPLTDPTTGQPTNFWLSGDPVLRKGWTDGSIDNPGDRRMLQTSGPFTMSLGDTQEVVVGVVGGIGSDYLNSITVMKTNDRTAQEIYNSLFTIIPPTVSVDVTYSPLVLHFTAKGEAGKFSSVTARIGDVAVPLFDDGAHHDGASGDGIWGDTLVPNFSSETPFSADLEFVTTGGKSVVVKNASPLITMVGPLAVTGATVLFDNVNNNGIVNNGEYVTFTLSVQNTTSVYLTGVRLTLAAGEPTFTEAMIGTIAQGAVGKTPASSPLSFRLPLNYAEPFYPVRYHLTDSKGNLWDGVWNFPVVQVTVAADTLPVTASNVIGKNDAFLTTVVYDRTLAGKTYHVWFGGNGSSLRNFTVVDPSNISLSASILPPTYQPFGTTMTATGKAQFSVNSEKTQAQYTVTVQNPASAVTGAKICVGAAGVNGPEALTMAPTSSNTFAGTWNIPDSLVDELIAGNLYVNVLTSSNPAGESRGQIADGASVRSALGPPPIGSSPLFIAYPETRLVGFSLYVGPAPTGTKSVKQTAPTVGSVMDAVNPEGTYRLVDSTKLHWAGERANEDNISLRFDTKDNYAIGIPKGATVSGSSVYVVKVPFAVFKDTSRVWPVILDAAKDTVWNTRSNTLWNGKPRFDMISGIADVADGIGNNLRYNATGTTPATAMRSRLINSVNFIAKNMWIVNESADSVLPAAGTEITFAQYQSVKIGDVKSFSLKTLGVTEQISAVPSSFEVSQNFPNPFNPSTTIEFAVPHHAAVEMRVYDVVGREVRQLVNSEFDAGRYRTTWDGRNSAGRPVSSGVYFCRVRTGALQKTVKMLLMK